MTVQGRPVAEAMAQDVVAALVADRLGLAASSTAERVAVLLRDRITEGLFAPGAQLPEEVLVGALGVSRNTLREAFRLLCHERLTVHEMNRGVFVRALARADVVDLYRLRRLVEGGAVREARSAPASALEAVTAAVEDAEASARCGDWLGVRTADLYFHQCIGALAQSPRVDEVMRRALAELRLAFYAMSDPEPFHRPYIAWNREIAALLSAGRAREAGKELGAYLAHAELQVLAGYDRADGSSSRPNGTSGRRTGKVPPANYLGGRSISGRLATVVPASGRPSSSSAVPKGREK